MKAIEKKQYASPACEAMTLCTSCILAGSQEEATKMKVYNTFEYYDYETDEQY